MMKKLLKLSGVLAIYITLISTIGNNPIARKRHEPLKHATI
jgi:hypothetical protein